MSDTTVVAKPSKKEAELARMEEVRDYILANKGEADKNGGFSLEKKHYTHLMGENGFTEDLLKDYHKAHRVITGGLMLAAETVTTDRVAALKTEGKDATDAKASLEINTLDGYISATTRAHNTANVPPRTNADGSKSGGGTVPVFGQTVVRMRATSIIPNSAADLIQERMKALIGPMVTE